MPTLQKISCSCYAFLELPYRAERTVNSGFVIGKGRTVIVDAGSGRPSAQHLHGCAVSLQPMNTLIVVNTECHIDHTGGNGYFRELGIDIYGHHMIGKGSVQADLHERNEFNSTRSMAGKPRRVVFFPGVEPVPPNRPLFADMIISLGALRVQLILTPGHTHTNLSIYVPDEGVVYCGDCLAGKADPPVRLLGSAQRHAWLRSLDRIAALTPKVVVPGHGPLLQEADLQCALYRYRSLLRTEIS